MNQTKLESALEMCVSTGSGFILAWLSWKFVIIPMVYAGWIRIDSTTFITMYFTVLSLGRGFTFRRLFNAGIHKFILGVVRRLYQQKPRS